MSGVEKSGKCLPSPAESIGPGIFIAVRSGRSKKAAVDWPSSPGDDHQRRADMKKLFTANKYVPVAVGSTVRLYRLVLGPPTDLARRRNDKSPLSAKAVR